jgi:hypothetical protein
MSASNIGPSRAPDTVTEALRLLADEGYTESFDVDKGVARCHGCGDVHEPEGAVVERIFRFEGMSDPDDEEIVFGLRCPACGARGTLVSAFGPLADPDELAALRILGRRGA